MKAEVDGENVALQYGELVDEGGKGEEGNALAVVLGEGDRCNFNGGVGQGVGKSVCITVGVRTCLGVVLVGGEGV